MFQKALIAEDHQSSNISVRVTLEELGVPQDYVYYCDDALSRIENSKFQGLFYDLLITDLSFEEDSRVQKIKNGVELIAAAKKVLPALKILVFSVESKPAEIEKLFNNENVDGFVRKARNDTREIKSAIYNLDQGLRYFPRQLLQLIRQKNTHEFTEFDITIITLLARGMQQKHIPDYLKQNNIRPSGLSSIEKRLNHIKDVLEFTKNEQIVAFCKDMGII
jgi:two-component system capsular synthesis response regulator RcsB